MAALEHNGTLSSSYPHPASLPSIQLFLGNCVFLTFLNSILFDLGI